MNRPLMSLVLVTALGAGAILITGVASARAAAEDRAPRLTIYSQDFALVSERRVMTLPRGIGTLAIADVPARLEPDSVVLRDPSGAAGFRVLTQTFRALPLDREEMLRRSEGKTLKFLVTEPGTGRTEVVTGHLVRAPGAGDAAGAWSAIVEMEGAVRFSLPGEPLFDGIPAGARLRPVIEWEVQSDRGGEGHLDLSYSTAGLGWDAVYSIVLPEKGDQFDLVGRIGLSNQSGTTYRDARVRLLAGEIARAAKPAPMPHMLRQRAEVAAMAPMEASDQVQEQAFDEFHVYALPRPVTVEDGSTTHVEFCRGDRVRAQRVYIYDALQMPGFFGLVQNDPGFGTQGGTRVRTVLEFVNQKDSGLGVPLPAGTVRIERVDGEGHRVLVGEPRLGHTAADEKIRLDLGTAFDLVGERRQTDFRVQQDRKLTEEAFEIKVRNRKKEAATVRVVEHLVRWATWKVLESSDPYEKKDAHTIEFAVPLQPGAEKVLTYRVRYTW